MKKANTVSASKLNTSFTSKKKQVGKKNNTNFKSSQS